METDTVGCLVMMMASFNKTKGALELKQGRNNISKETELMAKDATLVVFDVPTEPDISDITE